MSVYTTTLEVIINNTCENRNANIKERILSAINYIFDFEYPFPKLNYLTNDFKKYFEYSFCLKYFNYEIEQETVARFKLALQSQLYLIMPKYFFIFETLNKVNFDEILTNNKEIETIKNNNNNKTETQTGSKSASANLPENMLNKAQIGNFTNVGFADSSNITRQDTESNTENTGTTERERTSRTLSQIEIIKSMDNNFANYFENLLNEFKILFTDLLY